MIGMIFVYQILWAIWGLFLGLLIVTPWIPTTTYSTQLVYTVLIVGSLIGILGFFQWAWFVTACAAVLVIKNVIKRIMVAVNDHKPVVEHTEHKALERKI